MAAFPPIDASSLDAHWRRVWQFDAHAAPASLISRLIVTMMNIDKDVTVLSMWRNGIELSLMCADTPLHSERSQRRRQFFASLTFDVDSMEERTIVLDTFCGRTIDDRQRRNNDTTLLRDKSTNNDVSSLLPTAQLLLSKFVQLIQRTVNGCDIAARRLIM